MKYSCDLISGQISKEELKKIVKDNFWYSGESPAVFQTCHPFMIGFGLLKSHFDFAYNIFIDVHRGHFVSFFATEDDSLKVGEMLHEGFAKDPKFIYSKQRRWREDLAKLHEKGQEIFKTDLSKLSNQELAEIYDEFLHRFYTAWTIPLILEMNTVYVEQVLLPKLKKQLNLSESEFNEVFTCLTQPKEFSYLTVERMDLIKLVKEFSPEKLQEHHEKYYWIKSSYRRFGDYDKEAIKKLVDGEISKGKKHTERELINMEKAPEEIEKRQTEIIEKYKISPDIQRRFQGMAVMGDWQDKRKEMNIYGNHHIFMLLNEIGNRLKVDVDLLGSAFPSETKEALLEESTLDKKELQKRVDFSLHAVNTKLEEIFLVGEEAKNPKEIIDKKIEERFKEIKGMVASVGKVTHFKGKVRAVLDPLGVDIEKGSVLVTPMTRPDFVHLMYKSGAIVTDQGGITSHAAILSRELNIPCIVGTGIATRMLKDGDMVRVDTQSGLVTKLN